jgi:hypothetical protein
MAKKRAPRPLRGQEPASPILGVLSVRNCGIIAAISRRRNAATLPFKGKSFDADVSLLALNFVPNAATPWACRASDDDAEV